MESVNDRAVRGDGHIVTDRDRALANDVRTLFDQDAIADAQICIPAHVRPMYDFNSRKVANLSTTPDANAAWIVDQQGFEKHRPPAQ